MSPWTPLTLAWLLACVATTGSLFFSEVMHFPPCSLCWYQRICMYPLTVILLPAVLNYDRTVLKYSVPLASIGTIISIYHNLVYVGLIPETLSPCSMGVSCKAKFIQWFGFLDIPQMSLIAFILVLASLFQTRRLSTHE